MISWWSHDDLMMISWWSHDDLMICHCNRLSVSSAWTLLLNVCQPTFKQSLQNIANMFSFWAGVPVSMQQLSFRSEQVCFFQRISPWQGYKSRTFLKPNTLSALPTSASDYLLLNFSYTNWGCSHNILVWNQKSFSNGFQVMGSFKVMQWTATNLRSNTKQHRVVVFALFVSFIFY